MMTGNAGTLDVNQIAKKLMQPIGKQQSAPLNHRATEFDSMISAYGSLEGAFSTYQMALQGMTQTNQGGLRSHVTNEGTGTNLTNDAFTAIVGGDEQYKASSQKLRSRSFANTHIFQRGDTIAIKTGSGNPTVISLSAPATLAGLASTINAAKAGVYATVEHSEQGRHLVLESTAAGTANTIMIDASNSLDALSFNPARSHSKQMVQIQAPRDIGKVAPGSYHVEVLQLAQMHKLCSAGFPGYATFADGILAIKAGQCATTVISAKGMTLVGLRDTINTSGAGVNASVIGNGEQQFLLMSANESGASNTLRVSGTGDFSPFNFDPSGKLSSRAVVTGHTYDSGVLQLRVGSSNVWINPVAADGAVTLEDVVTAINAAAAGATATLNRKAGQDILVLVPRGMDAIELLGTGSYAGLSGKSMGQVTKAQDARATIDGVEVSSPTNQIGNAISGVQLNLSKVSTPADKLRLVLSLESNGPASAADNFFPACGILGIAAARPEHATGEDDGHKLEK